jgi:hypothetical protein
MSDMISFVKTTALKKRYSICISSNPGPVRPVKYKKAVFFLLEEENSLFVNKTLPRSD